MRLRSARRRAALRGLAAAPLLFLLGPAAAQRSDLMEDVDYFVIPQQRLSNTERIEVAYFFYYGCQWCFQFEPLMNECKEFLKIFSASLATAKRNR